VINCILQLFSLTQGPKSKPKTYSDSSWDGASNHVNVNQILPINSYFECSSTQQTPKIYLSSIRSPMKRDWFLWEFELILTWFDAPSHEESEYVFGFDFGPCFSEKSCKIQFITIICDKIQFFRFRFLTDYSILIISSSKQKRFGNFFYQNAQN